MQISIESQALALMQSHALNTFPYECCGFFYGSTEEGRIRVREARPVANSKEGDQRRRFEVAPLDYMQAERYALLQNTELLGIYHSHPLHPAIPSEHDLKQALPNFSYIILAVEEEEVKALRSWRLDTHNQFREEAISFPALFTYLKSINLKPEIQ